ncbi:gamma carbonic anhydrase family protein [Halomonas sp. MS1]|nr:gamma carbonic anhydrase family protein [Halomonas sp. MS1]UTD56626.1 gamma carbonic anhydrase family protein [Halomonas sp. MS1]
MSIYRYNGKQPDIHTNTFVADTADVIGNVSLANGSSVWYQAVLRGDNELIEVGEASNIQECAVLHTDPGYPLKIGCGVTIGHQAMLHGCTVGDNSLIGIQAIILNGAVIGKNCLVAAGAVVTEGKEFPDNSLIVGAPAKVVRELSDKAIAEIRENASHYVEKAQQHKCKLEKIS